MANLSLKNLKKSFGSFEIIKGIDLEIEDHEFCVFVGPSGCGKSTLLRLIAGLEEITSGDLLIAGKRVNDVPPDERGLAMVFQSYALYPHMTVRENMGFALKLAKVPQAERDARVEKVAELLELRSYLDRKPKALSGGQRQRVAIGRAIIREPSIFLFDEPLSNLDAALRVQTRIELARLHERLGSTMIYVTHDQVEAMTLADKIVVLKDGKIEQVGSPMELYHHPVNRFVGGFIGSPKMNFITASVASANNSGVEVILPGGARMTVPVSGGKIAGGGNVDLGVRPEHLTVTADGPLLGKVVVVERLGSETFVHVELSHDLIVIAQVDGGNPVRVHDDVRLTATPNACHVFSSDGSSLPALTQHPLAAGTI
ncbi:sn-glycerol-3-phosphate ABC transporter ATP-binding protein UgpC [Agrobacterium rubi]|uniref:ABC transporter ATP-binding protein n=1 Tax=Agrobacterium rubi TaxID=28099 RepID=UPI001571B401|nr:sn-glycerol-3-phosphate ABC transporter ATP-binding protein UgpC [Agrobacterium rubi]NTF10561.1 sn-glycerol-3-phosphate ABC transporter ATP-binding protein UgpC [Agrobacterium rubi]NTF22955.1 sn-glycerol-3-phosphate ABC transporter ATP-binding protein UgpC [Agrobacterium rubi]NTF29886.1 sn-glycerol-3-phosphate ABC transporter ATP-binding protein UgpC [Agrobacterium rubi]